MYGMRKVFAYLLIGLFAYLLIPPQVSAAGEFQADYDVAYNIAPDGRTIVTQNISLTNKLTNLYPTKYTILIDTDKIRDVVAYDRKGAISPTLNQKDGKTEITLTFNDQVVGLGKRLTFTLRFTNEDIAQKVGSIWEVNVPGVVSDPDIGSYNVSLEVPPAFGPPSYISPAPAAGKRWNKTQMMAGGISAAYGNMQVFSLTLSYFLQNTGATRGIGEIALPPDTSYQKVVIRSLEPKPLTVRQDGDGNWLAQYELASGQKLDIDAAVNIFITMTPRSTFVSRPPTGNQYTKPLKFWEADDSRIIGEAQKLRTPRAIYDYVVSSLSYDYGRVNSSPTRKGSLGALATPKNSICMEFTDLFIAIARAAGIPAREVVGYAYTTNAKLRPLSLVADVLHAWPEYFDSEKGIWIPVDPTWANTTGGVNYFDKLDFNHIVFAVHGENSELPYPVGFYKQPGANGKDVLVAFGDAGQLPAQSPKLTSTFKLPKVIPAGFTTKGELVIENTGGIASEAVEISVVSSDLPFSFTSRVNSIAPYEKHTIPITIPIDNFLRWETAEIAASVNGDMTRYSVPIQPAFILMLPFAVGLLLLTLGVWYILVKKSLWTLIRR